MNVSASPAVASPLPKAASAQTRLLLPFLFERRAADRAAEALAGASSGIARGLWTREPPRKLYRYRLEMTGQLDRFLVRVDLGYPSEVGEGAIARRYSERREPLDSVPVVADADAIREAREAVRTVLVAGDVESYLVSLCRATRGHRDLRLGASPRATVALYRASQAWAALDGRSFVLPDDVTAVAPAVLAHRLLLDIDRELAGATAALVLAEVLASVPVPVPSGT
jgi:hypothetical protein